MKDLEIERKNEHPEDILPTRHILGKRSPLVIAGALSTAAVLLAGLGQFKAGNQKQSQNMMRLRVVMQGMTVMLMVGTSGVAFADLGKLENVFNQQKAKKELIERF